MNRPLHVLPLDEQDRIVLAVHLLAHRFATRRRYSDLADDIIQEATLRCLMSLRDGRWSVDPDRLTNVVRNLVRRTAIDLLRSTQRRRDRDHEHGRERFEGLPAWMSPEVMMDENELATYREQTLDQLPESWRRPYLMVRQDNEPYRAVAERLGLSPAAVHQSITGVQQLFRDTLPTVGIYPPISARGGRPRKAARQLGPTSPPRDRRRRSTAKAER